MVHSAEDGSIPVADMSALIARLEAAEAGSRELDAVLWYALFEPDVDYPGIHTEQTEQGPREVLTCELGSKWADDVGPYTTSIDAALALAERVLPGYLINLCQSQDRWDASLDSEDDIYAHGAHANTAALALCIAILRGIPHGYEAAGEVSPNLKAKAQGEGG